MKKWRMLVIAALAVVLLVACGQSGAGQNFGEVVGEWRPQNDAARSVAPAEIGTYDSPDFGDVLGFDVTEYPDTAALSPQKFFTIDDWFGQIEYVTEDERTLVVRVAKKEGKSLAATYTGSYAAGDELRQVDGMEVRVGTAADGAVMVSWTRGEYQYVLHSAGGQDAPSEEEIEMFVKEMDSAPAPE